MAREYDPRQKSSSLHLPRMLCLHGGGTNSAIFRVQCRAITKALKTTFRFCFVEAPYISGSPGPDVTRVFQDMGPFKSWLRWRAEDPLRDHEEAFQRIDDAILTAMIEDDRLGATGDWVGLVGFSQGAKLCASMLYTQQYQSDVLDEDSIWPRFRFAVLVAGRGPLVWLGPESEVPTGLVDASTVSTATYEHLPRIAPERRLRTPTLHVHGAEDPGLPLHRELLYQYCDTTCTRRIEWPGGHRMPIKTVDVAKVVQGILTMAKTVHAI